MDGCNVFFLFFCKKGSQSKVYREKKTLNVYVVMNLTVRGKIRDQQRVRCNLS